MNKPSFGYCWAVHLIGGSTKPHDFWSVHDSFIKPSYLEHFSTLSLDPLDIIRKNVIIKDNI